MYAVGVVAVGLSAGYVVYRKLKKENAPQQEEVAMSSLEVGEDQARLKSQYDAMEETFMSRNLNLSFIAANEKYYGEEGSPKGQGNKERAKIKALTYEEVDGALAKDMCRLIILPMDPNPQLAARLYAAASQVVEIIPLEINVFQNPAEILHITLFHTSRVHDAVPGHVDANDQKAFIAKYIKEEDETLRTIIQSSPPPKLTFNRLLLADSGVLLAVWLDETDAISQIRQKFRQQCPQAPKKQTAIIHTTLFRIISPTRLSPEVQSNVSQICATLTQELQDLTWNPNMARVVIETHFSTVQGPFFDVPLLKLS